MIPFLAGLLCGGIAVAAGFMLILGGVGRDVPDVPRTAEERATAGEAG